MLKNSVGIQKFARFAAIAGLILAVMMTAVPAETIFAAPVQQAAGPVVAATDASSVTTQGPTQPQQAAWSIEIWPTADCSGWSIQFDRAYGTADEQWRAKLDGTVFTSGTISLASGSKTVTGAWPTGVDLTTGSHTLQAEIYEGGSWLYRTATFGPCTSAEVSKACWGRMIRP